MPDTPTPAPAPRTTDAPVGEPVAQAEPSKTKPVVLATPRTEEFVLPGEGSGDEPLRITPAGVALSGAAAKRVQEAAERSGQHIITLTEKD